MTPEEMARLHAQCFPDAPWSADAFSTLIGQPTVRVLSAPAGFLLLRVVATEAEVLTVAVAPAKQRKGIGTRLVEAAMDTASQVGATAIFLDVAADNLAAIHLYSQLGFLETGRRVGYYKRKGGARIDAMLMQCALT